MLWGSFLLWRDTAAAVPFRRCSSGFRSIRFNWDCLLSARAISIKIYCVYGYREKTENTVLKYCVKKAKHLLVPLYIWNAVYALLILLLQRWGFTIGAEVTLRNLLISPIDNGHQFIYNMGGWFMVPLFLVQIFNVNIRYLFKKIPSKYKEHILFLLYMALGMIGIQLAHAGYRTGWWLVLVRTLYFIPFFGAGTYYKNILEKRDCLSNTPYFLAVFSLQLLIILINKKVPAYTPSWCADFNDGPVLPFIEGFLGIALWLRIARILEPSIGKSRTIRWIADNTYSITINHFLGFMLVKLLFAVHYKLGFAPDFDMHLFKTDIWYYYLPYGLWHTLSLYLFAGISVPILMQRCIVFFKSRMIIRGKNIRSTAAAAE